jgi:uncharacterized membrane protein
MKKQAITLGRIGILLPIAAIIPIINMFVGIAVIVLLLMSHNYFSKVYEKPLIFKNALIGTIIEIAANIVGWIIFAIAIGSAALSMSSGGEVDPGNFQKITSLLFESAATIIGGIIILAGLIIGFYFIWQGLKLLAEQTGVKLFNTAGLLYFIGAIGTIVFGLGFIVIFAAWIVHIVAYFTVQPDEKPAEATTA